MENLWEIKCLIGIGCGDGEVVEWIGNVKPSPLFGPTVFRRYVVHAAVVLEDIEGFVQTVSGHELGKPAPSPRIAFTSLPVLTQMACLSINFCPFWMRSRGSLRLSSGSSSGNSSRKDLILNDVPEPGSCSTWSRRARR